MEEQGSSGPDRPTHLITIVAQCGKWYGVEGEGGASAGALPEVKGAPLAPDVPKGSICCTAHCVALVCDTCGHCICTCPLPL